MTDAAAPTPSNQGRILRSVLLTLLLLLVMLLAAVFVMLSTNKGSQFLLDRVLSQQKMIQFKYGQGNLLTGITLKDLFIQLKKTDIKADRAEVELGWRALFSKEIHLYRADIQNLQVISKGPATNKAFVFNDIKLPFVLRIDHAKLDHLTIQNHNNQVNIYGITLNEALWSNTTLRFKDSAMNMGYLDLKNADGQIDFKGKYPLNATGDLTLPALTTLHVKTIRVYAQGTLETIQAGLATRTPDLLTGWVVVRPLQPAVPMFGELKFNQYHWPIATAQKLYSQAGVAHFQGNIHQLNLGLALDVVGQNVPKGNYTAQMSTDLTNKLNIHDLKGQLMGGQVNLMGEVGWHKQISWNVQGRLQGLNPKDKKLPQVLQDFLPPHLDSNIRSSGERNQRLKAMVNLDFDRHENWALTLNQLVSAKSEPLLMNVAWQNIDRSMPYIGWLSSNSGQVDVALKASGQTVQVKTEVAPNAQSALPAGRYNANLILQKDNVLLVPNFHLQAGTGSLKGKAKLNLPTQKRQLSWNATLQAESFNPQLINPASPVNLLNGQLQASGFAQPNQQTIQLKAIDLMGRLTQNTAHPWVGLTGQSTTALLFNPSNAGGGLKSFAVRYDGELNAFEQGKGPLVVRISGTPERINIEKIQHSGAAGKIFASGWLNLKNALAWDMQASLVRFKPQYFMSTATGEISGHVNSSGVWSPKLKRIDIRQLNMAGYLNHKILRATGNLSVLLNDAQSSLIPQQFQANNLRLAYGKNQIEATGNTQNLRINVNAPDLTDVYSGLTGRAYGYVNVQSQPRLEATANLAIDNFNYLNQIKLKKLRIQGQLPTSDQTPSLLTANIQNLSQGKRQIDRAEVRLAGTRRAQILTLKGSNTLSQFYVQIAGGFRGNNWLGLLQKGDFDSKRIHLRQQQDAAIIYNTTQKQIFVGAHCWTSGKTTQLCLDQPLTASSARGNVSLTTQNLELGDFAAFMPEGLAISGKLNGYAKASWQNAGAPQLDLKMDTQNGFIGLAAENPQDPDTTVAYDQVRVIARSVSQGMLLRLDIKTPNIGTGYAKVLINPTLSPMPMTGEVALDAVQLKIFKPFIADVRNLDGRLALAGKINGTLTAPQFTGEMRLKDGAISMISLPVNINNIQVYSAIRENTASIDGAFNSGRGAGTLKGSIDWKDDPRIQLKLKGDKLYIRQVPLIRAQVTPDLNLEVLPKSKKLTLTGTVDIPRALISMPESSKAMVNISPDVRVVRRGQNALALVRAAQPWDIRADIAVNIGDQVIFQGFNSRIPLVGRLNLSQRGLDTALRANGAIGVSQKVKIEAYGQSLDLNRAIARFNGPISNPTLDIDANKSVQGSMVGVRVTGTGAVPNIQIYNDAGLSEQEALNAIVTGRITEGSSGLSNTAGFKSDVNTTIAAAGISLGLGGTRALTNQIGKSFGLNGLALDAQGAGDDTQVSVTGYISPDLYIRYGVGVFTNVNKLTLRYQINKRMYLEASESLERAIDVFYNWRF